MKNDSVSRSWFCVFNNPEEHGFLVLLMKLLNA